MLSLERAVPVCHFSLGTRQGLPPVSGLSPCVYSLTTHCSFSQLAAADMEIDKEKMSGALHQASVQLQAVLQATPQTIVRAGVITKLGRIP